MFRYKGREINPPAIGRELNVRAVLTGRMMHSADSLRIGTELVDVATGCQLWGAQYDRKPGDIFVVQDEISKEISGKLRLQLTRAEKKRITKHNTEDPEAYRLYLKGRHHWNRWAEEGFYKAIEYFQQAVEKDPSYALAYTGLADSYVLLGWNSYLPPKEAFPKGNEAAMTALRRPRSHEAPRLLPPCSGFTIGIGKRLRQNSSAASNCVPPTQLPTTGTPSL